jgi:tryptophan 2,3-dioxygenase
MTTSYDPAREGAQMNLKGGMSYADYLHLERILDAQEPLSTAHDELLFIIQHQTSELWMKLAIHEVHSAIDAIRGDRLQAAFKMLTRVARIFEQLNSAWDVLRTMTPSEYTRFRDALGQSSGFQSYQYRVIEFLAGNRNAAMLKPTSTGRTFWRSWRRCLPHRAFTTKRCGCWRATVRHRRGCAANRLAREPGGEPRGAASLESRLCGAGALLVAL